MGSIPFFLALATLIFADSSITAITESDDKASGNYATNNRLMISMKL